MGRKTKKSDELTKVIMECYELGMIDRQVCDIVGITDTTLNTWKKKYPEFLASIRLAKAKHDNDVECALLKAAKGHEYTTSKVIVDKTGNEHCIPETNYYPPNPTSAIFWLKNRRGWRDKLDHELSGKEGAPIELVVKDYREEE